MKDNKWRLLPQDNVPRRSPCNIVTLARSALERVTTQVCQRELHLCLGTKRTTTSCLKFKVSYQHLRDSLDVFFWETVSPPVMDKT